MICPQCGCANLLAAKLCTRAGGSTRASGRGSEHPGGGRNIDSGTAGRAPPVDRAGAEYGVAGRYRVQRALGRGSFGQVYLAHDGPDAKGRPVAIKALQTDACRSDSEVQEAMAWFKREVSQLLTLDHPRLPGA